MNGQMDGYPATGGEVEWLGDYKRLPFWKMLEPPVFGGSNETIRGKNKNKNKNVLK